VFVTQSDDPGAWLATGQALQRVLLGAAGVWSSFLDQPIEVAEVRPRLADAIGRPGDYPQLLVRFGYARPVKTEPRRAVEEVLREESEPGR
jgi:hypothetical protein